MRRFTDNTLFVAKSTGIHCPFNLEHIMDQKNALAMLNFHELNQSQ